jgi:hypothetical protein
MKSLPLKLKTEPFSLKVSRWIPRLSSSEIGERFFWRHDLKVARQILGGAISSFLGMMRVAIYAGVPAKGVGRQDTENHWRQLRALGETQRWTAAQEHVSRLTGKTQRPLLFHGCLSHTRRVMATMSHPL